MKKKGSFETLPLELRQRIFQFKRVLHFNQRIQWLENHLRFPETVLDDDQPKGTWHFYIDNDTHCLFWSMYYMTVENMTVFLFWKLSYMVSYPSGQQKELAYYFA